MLLKRLITILIMLPLTILFLIYSPRWGIISGFLFLMSISIYELAYMILPRIEALFKNSEKDRINVSIYNIIFCVGICIVFFLLTLAGTLPVKSVFSLAIILSLITAFFFSTSITVAFGRLAGYLLCICYGSFFWVAIYDLYFMSKDLKYFALLLAIVWGGDTGAYIGGSLFGKHKLSPKISPSKTWEGAFFGLILSIGLAYLVNYFYKYNLGSFNLILVASILTGIAGQFGDLSESAIKRFSKVKDSGYILPGHGGFLDRLDGLLFAAPVLWFVFYCCSHF